MTFSVTGVFEGADKLTLSAGLMIYTDGQQARLVTAHRAIAPATEGQPPRLGPPVLVTRESVLGLLRGLENIPQDRFLLSERVLCWEAGLLCWWRPAGRRRIFFKTNNDALNALNGLEVMHPPLVFKAQRDVLSIWALKEDKRPTGETRLCRAPYYNVYDAGNMCTGTVPLPREVRPDEIEKWEECFFGSNFAHSNLQSLVDHPKGHTGYWVYLARPTAPRSYAMKYLQELPLTLSRIIR